MMLSMSLGFQAQKSIGFFDTLEDKGPELIVARHEQNAAFMAQGVGRITGKPGVVLVTSGPGVSNLATGLVNSERMKETLFLLLVVRLSVQIS